jgi:hypothetical protein
MFEAPTQAAQTQFEEHLNAPPALNSFGLEWPSPSADGSARSLFIDAPVFTVDAALAPTSLRFLEETIPARADSDPSIYYSGRNLMHNVHTYLPAGHAQQLDPFLFISCPSRCSMVMGFSTLRAPQGHV